MRTFVVYESQFGNTHTIAQAIADGLGGAELIAVDDAPATLPPDLALLVIGGPTHAFSMSRPQTREDAGRQGAPATTSGIREWIDTLRPDGAGPRVAVFSTKMGHTPFSGSAAKAAVRHVRHRGFEVHDAADFHVVGTHGPLEDDEVARATEWGRRLRD